MRTEQEWREFMRKDIATCEKILTTEGSLPPTFLVHCPGVIHIIGVQFEPKTTNKLLTLMRTFCIAKEAFALSYLMEAWTASIDVADVATLETAKRDGVKSLASRIEVVMAMTEYRRDQPTLGRLQQCHPIERNDRKQITGLGLNMWTEDAGDMTGRFVNFLMPKEPSADTVARAKIVIEHYGDAMIRVDAPPAEPN